MSEELIIQRQALEERWSLQDPQCTQDSRFQAGVERLLLLGPVAYALLAEHGVTLFRLWKTGDQSLRSNGAQWAQELEALADETPRIDQLLAELGVFNACRRLETLWLDVVERAQLKLISQRQSRLVEAIVRAVVRHVQASMELESGRPVNHEGEPQNMVVLALGRLGAEELTSMGSAELALAFTGHGHCAGNAEVTNEQFFKDLSERLLHMLADGHQSGLVSIDLSKRPLGDSGPVCLSCEAIEHHYETHGRASDRHALIKARPLSEASRAGESLLSALRPFIYRRYLDFNMLDALRKRKMAISQAGVASTDLHAGPGGLGEIEFVVRAVQLVRGGRQPQLQVASLPQALDALAASDGLPATTCKALAKAYEFLQRTVNRLQWMTGTDTFQLPENPEPQLALASTMDHVTWQAFLLQLEEHRQFVRGEFDATFASEDQPEGPYTQWQEIWEMPISPEHSQAQLSLRGFVRAAEAVDLLKQLRYGPAHGGMSERSAQRLDQFMPAVLAVCSRTDDPDESLLRMVNLLRAIRGRSTYIALLAERPEVLKKLVGLLAAPWIARELTRYPILLDEVLDARPLLDVSSTAALQAALTAELGVATEQDLEAEMDALRRFRRSVTLQIARMRLANENAVEQTQRSLGLVAECIVRAALGFAWRDVRGPGEPEDPPLALIGFGALGSGELTFDAHLDLSFVRLDEADMGTCTRCAQRLVHILTAMTAAGRLYQVDNGLQARGNTGVIVAPISEFHEHQLSRAQILDTQALLRARFVSGSPVLASQFEQIRSEALLRKRDVEQLSGAIAANRALLSSRALATPESQFNLTSSPGGLLDIICLTHFYVLQHTDPGLIAKRNTGALLALLRARTLGEPQDIDDLLHAYHAYAAQMQQTTLLERTIEVPLNRAEPHVEKVKSIWQKTFRGA